MKLLENSFVFGDEYPDENSIQLKVPAGENLKTNDVQTRTFLRVDGDLLIDHLVHNVDCRKIYLSIYEDKSCTPDPNIKINIVSRMKCLTTKDT